MPVWLERLLDRALKIRPGEAGKVGLMALYSACAIGAVVVGRTVRDALFLADRPTADLPLMYIANAVAVALVSWGYSRIADKVRRDRLNALVAGLWAVVMAAFFLLVEVNARAFAPALYVSVEAMGSLVVIQFWTLAQDVFNAREAKRLFGLIGAGGQVANVVYGFVAASVAKHVSTESLLLLCAVNLVGCAVLAVVVGRRYPPVAPAVERLKVRRGARAPANRTGGIRALATRHLVTLALLAVFSALAVNLVDFQFKAAAEANFVDKRALGAFFGKFYGVCGAAALGIQMLLTGRVLERFGILTSLLPLPVGLAFGTIAAALWPGGWAASLAKGSDSIFRYTMNDASMQLLYVPVPPHQRGRAKALIDGLLKPMAGIVAGLLLIAIGRRTRLGPATGDVHSDLVTTVVIVLLVVGWMALLFPSRREYVRSLLDTLQKRRLDLVSTPISADQATADALAKVLRGGDTLAILHALALLPDVRGRDFAPLVAELLEHRVSSVRAAATDHFAQHVDAAYALPIRARLADKDPWCVASAIAALCAIEKERALPVVKPFLNDGRPGIRAAAVIGLVRHGGINGILEAADELKAQLAATGAAERELAASVLGELRMPTFYESLLKFLSDPHPSVRRAAMFAASRMKSPELVPHLVTLLADPKIWREAVVALASFGTGIEEPLGRALVDPKLPLASRRAIPAVLGRLGTKEAADRLQAALEADDPPLRAASARALARLMRRRHDVTVRREVVTRAVRFELELAEHLVDVHHGLELPRVDRASPVRAGRGEGAPELLALALVEERDRAIERAIVLLELLYPKAALDVVADNLRSEIPSRRANAVEVLDNTVREDLKKRLLPLLEDRLHRGPPPERRPDEWLAALVGGSSPWIAACAAQLALERGVAGAAPSLERALTSPTPFVREACANALARLAPNEAGAALAKLKDDPSPSVRKVVEGALVLARLASA